MIRTRVIRRDSAPSRNAPTDTGPAFIAGMSLKGNAEPLKIRSLDEADQKIGPKVSFSVVREWLETFFAEGGHEVTFSRVFGPSPTVATVNLTGTSGTTLVVNAKSPGDWASATTGGLAVEVADGPSGGTHRTIIIYERFPGGGNDVEVERIPEFTTRQEAIDWSASSDWVDIVAGGGTNSLPVVAAVANLAGGTDDHTNITQTQIDAALELLTADLGPGQIAAPDWQTSAAHLSLLAHAGANNRYALCDSTDTEAKATLLAAAALLQGGSDGEFGSFLSPWLKITGTSQGTTRSVPLSAFVAAKAAETDATAGPNQAPAGEYGKARSSLVLDVKATYTNQDEIDLQEAGVNLAILRYGGVLFDGNRTLVEPAGNDSEMLQLSTARYFMSLVGRFTPVGEGFEHRKITRKTIATFNLAITEIMQRDEQADYLLLDEDETPGSGFLVQTADPVNTPESIAAKELNAAVGVRPAPGAEFVFIYLSKVEPTDPLA